MAQYKADWDSLRQHSAPEWLRRAKFGIYTHWGVYSVPACRPNGSWYGFYMYQKGSPQYEHHLKTYGSPKDFGYKDFIPMFTGERFDPDEWAELFSEAGARFAGPVGEHHDGFSMWDTQLNRWNAKRMGPHRDVVGELEKSIRARNMKFMVALHHGENWRYFPHWVEESDLSDPDSRGLYGTPHNLNWKDGIPQRGAWPIWYEQDKPDQAFCDRWLAKCEEVIDRFQPDLLWFDFGLGILPESYRKRMMAYYYNKEAEWGRQLALTYKYHDMAPGSGMIDLELGRFDKMAYHDWLTDTTVDDGEGWCYLFDAKYKQAGDLVRYLADNVSKSGYGLLPVGPKPNGEIPEEAQRILREIGAWLRVNGEAIYDTTPWLISGEGPTQMTQSGMFSEGEKLAYTGEDIRFTQKEGTLYAVLLGWPGETALVKSLRELLPGEVRGVTMLGDARPLDWRQTEDGLRVALPKEKPCEHAWVLKVERNQPFQA